MTSSDILPPGTQIAYVPAHAKGDLKHPDVDYGFVQEDRGDTCLCRFWRKSRGKHQLGDLRTTANAESAAKRDLVLHEHYDQKVINNFLRVRGEAELSARKMYGMPLGLRKMR